MSGAAEPRNAGTGTELRRPEAAEVAPAGGSPPGSLRRMGSIAGLATISLLDLLALDDITTAGAWMPEIVFVIASIPALVTLGWFALKRPQPRPELPSADEERRLTP